MDTRRGANRAECIYTQEDFNDLSSGIRRMTIDTRFHLDRSRTLLRTRPHPRRASRTQASRILLLSCFLVKPI